MNEVLLRLEELLFLSDPEVALPAVLITLHDRLARLQYRSLRGEARIGLSPARLPVLRAAHRLSTQYVGKSPGDCEHGGPSAQRGPTTARRSRER